MVNLVGGDPLPSLWAAREILGTSATRSGWFGPARIAYDEAVNSLVRRLSVIAEAFGGV